MSVEEMEKRHSEVEMEGERERVRDSNHYRT